MISYCWSVCTLLLVQIVVYDNATFVTNCVPELMLEEAITYSLMAKQANCLESSPCTSPCPGDNMLVPVSVAVQMYEATLDRRRRKRTFAINIPNRKWSSPIPYMFNLSNSADASSSNIMNALAHIEAQSCVTFQQVARAATSNNPFIVFVSGPGCVAFAGQNLDSTLNPISLTAACAGDFGTVVNLVAMSLGLVHEEQRPDRNSYIYVNNNNVVPQHIPDLVLQNSSLFSTFGLPYDLASVMHSPPTIFSANGGLTLMTLDPFYENTIGQRTGLSFLDAKLINSLYCSGSCSVSLSCFNGGYPDPNNCAQCKCPDGYAAPLCHTLTPHDASTCGQQVNIINSGTGLIKSPGYDPPTQAYTPREQCTWQITAPIGSILSLTFFGDFGIYCENLACYHWVEVRYFYDQLNATGPRFCCQNLPNLTLISTGNTVVILFRSNYTSNFQTPTPIFRGFQLLYSVVVCKVVWSAPFMNLNSPGGKQAPYNVNAKECLDYCAYNLTGCLGVDLDTNTIPYPTCYTHTSQADLQITAIATNVNQYRILNTLCPTTSATTSPTTTTRPTMLPSTRPTPMKTTSGTTTTSTTTSPTTSTAAQPPVTTMSRYSTTSTPATIPTPPVTANVKNPTSTSPAPTTSVATQPTRPTPVMSTSATTVAPVKTTLTTSQQASSLFTTVSSGVCQTTWSIRNATNSLGATQIMSIASESSCLSYCVSNLSCVAVDINTNYNPPLCWVHVNISDLNTKYNTLGVNQFQLLTRCITSSTTSAPTTGSCQPTWNTLVSIHALAGVCQGTMSSSDCLTLCATTPTCIAVDYDTSLLQCWTHSASLGQEYYQANVVQYQLLTRCYTVAPTYPTTFTSLSGWGEWSDCSASCGAFGTQVRYYWVLTQNQFISVNVQYETCNTQVCLCLPYSNCSPCCGGYYAYAGFCYNN